YRPKHLHEPTSVALGIAALVEPEPPFVEIPEQMERLDADVGAAKRALEQRPEVFESVGVDLAARIRLGMVNDIVSVFAREPLIGLERVGVDFGPALDVLTDGGLQDVLAGGADDQRADLAGLVRPMRSSNPITAVLPMPPVPVIFS